MNRKAAFLSLGLALLVTAGGTARAQAPAGMTGNVLPREIEVGLTQLAGGDGEAAVASFETARSTDNSGLAELFMELTQAYVVDDPLISPESKTPSRKDRDLLDIASQHFHQRHIPPTVLGDALRRIRQLLKQAPAKGSSPRFLRPLLCNLRLLSGDRATDGEPVLEASGKSNNLGSLIRPRPQFTPSPHLTAAAKESRTGDTLEINVELVVDSEGCPASEKLLRPRHNALVDQALASLGWWAYEPARYDETAVGWKLPIYLTIRFVPGNPNGNPPG
jgi:hypothetical protein